MVALFNGKRRPGRSVEERLIRFASPEPNSGCWLWTGAVNKNGYGCLRVEGRTRSSHKLAWNIWRGDTGNLHVLHKCDNRCCINVEHMFLGTHQDNMNDRCKKGRSGSIRGENHNRSKLTEESVAQIRLISGKTLKEIAENYGVGISAIHAIRSGKNWIHIGDEK